MREDKTNLVPIELRMVSTVKKQVLLVKKRDLPGCYAEVTVWEFINKKWQPVFSPISATIGRSGLTSEQNKFEGDGCTPCGIYDLKLVFGSEEKMDTAMPYRQTGVDDYWVDDPASPQYNCWVKGEPQAASWEVMLRSDGLYHYGIVVEYNTLPVRAGKGSAIFIHLWQAPGEPTAGCIAMDSIDLLKIISWLSPEKQPVIFISNK